MRTSKPVVYVRCDRCMSDASEKCYYDYPIIAIEAIFNSERRPVDLCKRCAHEFDNWWNIRDV